MITVSVEKRTPYTAVKKAPKNIVAVKITVLSDFVLVAVVLAETIVTRRMPAEAMVVVVVPIMTTEKVLGKASKDVAVVTMKRVVMLVVVVPVQIVQSVFFVLKVVFV